MRFVTDECIPVDVRQVLTRARHQCWSIPQAGLSGENDDDVGAYADDKGAVLLTDDNEFYRRRRAEVFAQVVEIHGRKPMYAAIVKRHLRDLVDVLNRHRAIVVAISEAGVWITGPAHLAEPAPTLPSQKRRRPRSRD